MKSFKSFQKRTGKIFSEDISSFDLFYQLTYMSATSAAGISRNRIFQLARDLSNPAAQHFQRINELTENLRYSYPDACRMVGENVDSETTKNFLLRLSDALRSGEPLSPYLSREAKIQGEGYSGEYERKLESLQKWNDGYVAVIVSVALVVIINIVSTMIYDLGTSTMLAMMMVAAVSGLGVAWVISRAAPQEVKNVPLAEGCKEQHLARRLFQIFVPLTVIASLALILLGVDIGWIMITASLLLAPIGVASSIADKTISKKSEEISAFLRSIGGTATSRGTTLKNALNHIKIDSFPTLEPDINRLTLRLNAFGKPALCWKMFGTETGSKLIEQTVDMFFETVNLGGDPEQAGILSSEFAMTTTMLRARRIGVTATFTWLTIVMHTVLAALMVFLLAIIQQFANLLHDAMAGIQQGEEAMQSMATGIMVFNLPQIPLLRAMTMGMVIMIAAINAFAMVSSEGSHLIKMCSHLSVLLFLSGVSFIVVPPIVDVIWL